MACKTPGVHDVDTNTVATSVSEVAVAVTVFGAPTQLSLINGDSPRDRPWRISSMTGFIEHGGDEPGSPGGNGLSSE